MAKPASHSDLIRLNPFQKLMRRWKTLAPYNAGQVMEIAGTPDFCRWASAAQKVIQQTGLGRPEFQDNGNLVRFIQPSPLEVANSRSEDGGLSQVVTEEMNRPFDSNIPIRFFLLSKPSSYYFGATYDHWIADSRAMRELMHRIFIAYTGKADLPALKLPADDFETLYGHHPEVSRPLAVLRESLRSYIKHRGVYRLHLQNPLNFHSKTVVMALPQGLIKKIHQTAKQCGASVNDAFLTALAQCMGTMTAGERYKKRKRLFHGQRHKLGLGTIVDIRDASLKPLDQILGLYLSSYTTILQEPEKQSTRDLMLAIAAQTKHTKETKGALRSYLGLKQSCFWWDFYKHPKDKARFFQKNVPVVAGISNVNMSKSWVDTAQPPADGSPQILDYLRISPTGPLSPLVFTLTTINDRLSLCVTYRTTAFKDVRAGQIIDEFVTRLSNLAT